MTRIYYADAVKRVQEEGRAVDSARTALIVACGDDVPDLYAFDLFDKASTTYAALISLLKRVICCKECRGTGIVDEFVNQDLPRSDIPCPVCGPTREAVAKEKP